MNKNWNAPKTKQINIRLTEWEYQCLSQSSEASKMSISHFIRAILHELFNETEESG